nr:MAG TPA_asm: hypothetical protein [Caudoviricetes sp.]
MDGCALSNGYAIYLAKRTRSRLRRKLRRSSINLRSKILRSKCRLI